MGSAKKKCYGDCRVIDYDYDFLLIFENFSKIFFCNFFFRQNFRKISFRDFDFSSIKIFYNDFFRILFFQKNIFFSDRKSISHRLRRSPRKVIFST